MYRQGLNAAFQLGGTSLDRSMNLGTGAFNNSLQTAGNVETFNRNMQASQYNSWMNNNAAVQAANAQASAQQNAGMMGMFGGIGGGVASGLGSVGMGMALGGVSF
jgi:predicted lipid-binding transport protein (Tim44 family)